jgi:hypothetical protein
MLGCEIVGLGSKTRPSLARGSSTTAAVTASVDDLRIEPRCQNPLARDQGPYARHRTRAGPRLRYTPLWMRVERPRLPPPATMSCCGVTRSPLTARRRGGSARWCFAVTLLGVSRVLRWRPGHSTDMTIGTSIFLIALGAILAFAVNATVAGISIQTAGVILIAVGALGLVIGLFMLSRRPREADRTAYEDRPLYR